MWSAPRTVASGSQYVVGGPVAAVNRGADGVLAWATTPKRPVFSAGGFFGGGFSTPPGQVLGGSVVAVVGDVRGAFSRPVTVVRYRNDGPDDVRAAVSSTGAVFVTWTRIDSPRTLVARVGTQGATRPRVLLPRGAQLYELTSGLDGPILVSWQVPHNRGETLDDAPLLASGRLGPVRRLVFVPPSARQMELAFNDRGGALVAWLKTLSQRSQSVPSPAEVIVCPPAGRCEPTRTVPLGPPGAHANEFLAAALTDDDTAVVASDAQINTDPGGPSFPADAGVWAAVSRDGGPSAPQQQISATGNGPALAAVGRDGVVLSYTPPRAAPAADWDAPAVATLAPGGLHFRPAGQYPGTATGDVPFVLSGAGSGAFAVCWQTLVGNQDLARIAIGGPGGIGTPHGLGNTNFRAIALDGRGDALVGWSNARAVKQEVELPRQPARDTRNSHRRWFDS